MKNISQWRTLTTVFVLSVLLLAAVKMLGDVAQTAPEFAAEALASLSGTFMVFVLAVSGKSSAEHWARSRVVSTSDEEKELTR